MSSAQTASRLTAERDGVAADVTAFKPADWNRGFIIGKGFGRETLRHVARRAFSSEPLVLHLEPLVVSAPLRLVHRLMLSAADLVLVDDMESASILFAHRLSMARVLLTSAADTLAMFEAPADKPAAGPAVRLLHIGTLEPAAGTTALLEAAAGWAAMNPDRALGITWAGAGPMRGVLEAQPLPGNVCQDFRAFPTRDDLPALFHCNDILVTPACPCACSRILLEAMASGMPVLCSGAQAIPRGLVIEGETGWTFNPHMLGGIAITLARALAAQYRAVGANASAQVRSMARSTLTVRIVHALREKRGNHAIIPLFETGVATAAE